MTILVIVPIFVFVPVFVFVLVLIFVLVFSFVRHATMLGTESLDGAYMHCTLVERA